MQKMQKINNIIIHHSLTEDSETVSWGAIRKYHKEVMKFDDVGYHFGIENINGRLEVLIGRTLLWQGAHTRGFNGDSIGICIVGNFDNQEPSQELWELIIETVASLNIRLNVPIQNVRGHNNFSNKTCPGRHFNMEKFRKDLSEYLWKMEKI